MNQQQPPQGNPYQQQQPPQGNPYQQQPPPQGNPYQQQIIKKPIYKKWWFWLIVIVVIGVIGTALEGEATDAVDKHVADEVKTTESSKIEETAVKVVETTAKEAEKEFYGIGETATYKGIEVSLTNVAESEGKDFFTPEDGKVFIFPLFEIENNSNKDLHISSILSFDAYVDGYADSSSLSASVASDEDTLDGTVAPEKKLKGVYAMEVSEDWEEVEIIFEPASWRSSKIVFKFFKE